MPEDRALPALVNDAAAVPGEPSGARGQVTMADVAREAGCSLNTVSRALNGKPDISEETRRRVLEVVQRLGYIPHASARSLAAGRSNTIGLVIANATVPIYSTIISAVEEACDRHGFTLLLGHSRED